MSSQRRRARKLGPEDAGFILDDYVFYNLVRTVATYDEEMAKALKAFGLSTMTWRILMLLKDKSPSSVGDLARRAVVKTPTLTRMLTRMAADGLIVRRSFEDDRRVVDIVMTAKAGKALGLARAVGQRVFERAFEGVPAVEIAAVIDVVKRVRANLDRSPYEAADES